MVSDQGLSADEIVDVSHVLEKYVRDRATAEGKSSELTWEFLAAAIAHGYGWFFGITWTKDGIKGDWQQPYPGYLAQWKQDNTN